MSSHHVSVSFMSEPTLAENPSGMHSGADVLTQVRIAEAVGRITQYIADNSVSRLEWWLHPDRAAMRNEPIWNSVFSHISHTVGDSE